MYIYIYIPIKSSPHIYNRFLSKVLLIQRFNLSMCYVSICECLVYRFVYALCALFCLCCVRNLICVM